VLFGFASLIRGAAVAGPYLIRLVRHVKRSRA
jgi:hypothetical protein